MRSGWLALLMTSGAGGLASCGGGSEPTTTSSGELRVVAQCQANAAQDQIRVAFKVLDTSDHAIDLGDVAVRYYFTHTITTGAEPMMHVDYIEKGAMTDVYAAFSDAYVDIKFVATAVQLAPSDPAGGGQTQINLYASDYSNWDVSVTDDYSYSPCAAGTTASDFVPRPTMTAYVDGKLAWGVEP
jgi:hypothetical protein